VTDERNADMGLVERYREGKTEVPAETLVAVPLCTSLMPRDLARHRSRASAVTVRRLIARSLSEPSFLGDLMAKSLYNWGSVSR